jgi:hypothetical protein
MSAARNENMSEYALNQNSLRMTPNQQVSSRRAAPLVVAYSIYKRFQPPIDHRNPVNKRR